MEVFIERREEVSGSEFTLEFFDAIEERVVVELTRLPRDKRGHGERNGQDPNAHDDGEHVAVFKLMRMRVDNEYPTIDGDHGDAERRDEHDDNLHRVQELAPEGAHRPARRRDRDEERGRADGDEQNVREGQVEHERVACVAQTHVDHNQIDDERVAEQPERDYEQMHHDDDAQEWRLDFHVHVRRRVIQCA